MVARGIFVFFWVLTCCVSAWAASSKRPERLLEIKLQYLRCERDGLEKAAKLLSSIQGIRKTAVLADEKSTLVFFESGRTSVDEMLDVLKHKGYVATLVWGPIARGSDGQPEKISAAEMPRPHATLKEEKEKHVYHVSESERQAILKYIRGEATSIPKPVQH